MTAMLLALVALHLPGELRKPAGIVGSTAVTAIVEDARRAVARREEE